MKYLSTSILSIKDNLVDNIKLIDKYTDIIHLDIMDGLFVSNTTWNIDQTRRLIEGHNKPLDVHLMVKDVKKYVDEFSTLNPEYITFHLEAVNNVTEMILYIKQKDIKAGLAINPDTDVKKVYPYLDLVDLVLVMSVEPGKGGQKFLDSATSKIIRLKELKMDNGFNYQIEVDGGVNGETFTKCLNCDIFVVGSYITCSENYEERIQEVYGIIKA